MRHKPVTFEHIKQQPEVIVIKPQHQEKTPVIAHFTKATARSRSSDKKPPVVMGQHRTIQQRQNAVKIPALDLRSPKISVDKNSGYKNKNLMASLPSSGRADKHRPSSAAAA